MSSSKICIPFIVKTYFYSEHTFYLKAPNKYQPPIFCNRKCQCSLVNQIIVGDCLYSDLNLGMKFYILNQSNNEPGDWIS